MTNHEDHTEPASVWISAEDLRKSHIKVHEVVRGPFVPPKLLRMYFHDSILPNDLQSDNTHGEKMIYLNGIPRPWETSSTFEKHKPWKNLPCSIEFYVTKIIRDKFGLTMGQGIPNSSTNPTSIDPRYDSSRNSPEIVSEE